jgi:predicted ATP-grasp superfamily ATP-dependent carboligase
MRVLLYEWCSSGGLVGDDPAIAAEGRQMLEALAADAAKDSGLEVAVLAAADRPLALPPRARRLEVTPGGDRAALVAAAARADWSLVVAPESDGLLLDRVRAVRTAGGRVLAPTERVIALASDKQATIEALAARGLPVPAGRSLAPGEPVPEGFRRPAIRKARGGCGGEAVEIIRASGASPAAVATRIEALAEGTPVGVSLICGRRGPTALPVMRQRFSGGIAPRYLGSEFLADEAAGRRATALALAAARAVAADAGWLGVDLILGERPDGHGDRILEINPRVTTSIVGQAGRLATSLVAAMIEAVGPPGHASSS